jgi:hypothetical protein
MAPPPLVVVQSCLLRRAAGTKVIDRRGPDLEAVVEALRRDGVHFRNDIVTGVGGKQIMAEDPSGNPVELFEPVLQEAHLDSH